MADITTSKSRVSVVRGRHMASSLAKALDLIGGLGRIIRPGDTVLIKPNFGVGASWKTGIITDPGVIDILIPMCREERAGRILVGESTVVGFDTARVFAELGLTGRFERLGAQLVNLDQDEVAAVPVEDGSVLNNVNIYRTAIESDVIISVPTMKTHLLTGVSLGMKNMKGTLPDRMKKKMHRIGAKKKRKEYELEHAIADLISVIRPALTVIDGFIANEGYEPGTPGIGGTPLTFNTIVAGTDPVAVDAVGAYLMGFEPQEIRHIAYAQDRGLGTAQIARIDIAGGPLHQLRRHFKRPSLDGIIFDFGDVSIVAGEGCSGCRESTIIGLSAMSASELERVGKTAVIVGSHVEIGEKDAEKRLVLVGNCTFDTDLEGERIEGCPPPGVHVKKCLLDRY